MGINIDEIIAKEKEMSEIFQKIVDTQMINEDMSLDEMYCGDSEIIEKELKKYQDLADFHNQIINIICKYQKIKEIVKQEDYDRFNSHNYYGYFLRVQDIRKVIEDGNNK